VKILIKQGRVIDPGSGLDAVMDVLIKDDKIQAVEKKIDAEVTKTINASKYIIAPGFIDMHVHLREPGQEEKETIASGTKAAVRGGFTTILCMPNTTPVNDNPAITKYIIQEAEKQNLANVFPFAAITKGSKGETLTEMADLVDAGAIGFSDDGNTVMNSRVMRHALEHAKTLNVLISDHCEDKNLSKNGVMHEGYYSNLLGLKGIPSSAEEIIISRNIILAEKAVTGIHISHVSTKGSVDLIRNAKKKGIAVSAEVTPHHLLLSDESLQTYDPNLKVNPPLRSQEDITALIEAVKSKTIDVFATDHAPHTPDEKSVEIDSAPFGIIGLESAVPLLIDKLVHTGLISINQLIEMFSTRPAELIGFNHKGKISPGADADLTILDLEKKVKIDVSTFHSKARNCPFDGWLVKGSPEITIIGGKIKYPF
jgi:dihydroorotase